MMRAVGTDTVQSSGKALKSLFEPRSIAVVGASRHIESVGGALLANLVGGGFKGAIYPVKGVSCGTNSKNH